MRKIKSGKARFRQEDAVRGPPQAGNGNAPKKRDVGSTAGELALDSDLVLCSSKHGVEPGAVVGKKDRWGVKFHHL